MSSKSAIVVKFDRLPEVESKMVMAGKGITRQILDHIASEINQHGPYKEILDTKVVLAGGVGKVEVLPWWMGFIELGTVDRAARPFAGPISQRAFETLVPKLKAVGDSL